MLDEMGGLYHFWRAKVYILQIESISSPGTACGEKRVSRQLMIFSESSSVVKSYSLISFAYR